MHNKCNAWVFFLKPYERCVLCTCTTALYDGSVQQRNPTQNATLLGNVTLVEWSM
jgi:hypothetical protein